MFKQSTSLLMITSFVFLQACGMQQGGGGIDPLPPGASGNALTDQYEILDKACALSGDVNVNPRNLQCDKIDAQNAINPPAAPHESDDLPPEKKFWYQSPLTWVSLGVVGAASWITCRNSLFGADCSPWSPKENNTEYMSKVQTSTFLKGLGKVGFEPVSINGVNNVYIKMYNKVELAGNLFFYGKEYGNEVHSCIKALAAPASTGEGGTNGTGSVTLQLQIRQRDSLLTKDSVGTARFFKDNTCNQEGAWAGFGRVKNADSIHVSSINPSALGWNVTNIVDTKVINLKLDFINLDGSGSVRLINPDAPLILSADIPIEPETKARMEQACGTKTGLLKNECRVRSFLQMNSGAPAAPLGTENKATREIF